MKFLIASGNNCLKIFLTVIFAAMACSGEPNIDPKALEYVYKANLIMVSAGRREQVHAKAFAYLDSAIATDKRCKVAYGNKIRILKGLKRYNEALDVTNRLIAIDPSEPNAVVGKASLLKKLNDPYANAYFEKALHLFASELRWETKDDIVLQRLLGRSLCLYFLEGRDACVKEMNLIKKKFPESKTVDILLKEVSTKTEAEIIRNL